MKVIIAGSRNFNDYPLLKKKCDIFLSNQNNIEIVSGTARGADLLGERYAIENNYPIKFFVPEWDLLGKAAGFIRNRQMAEYADALIAFWDGVSVGTQNMIDIAKELKLKVRVILYEK